jgi:hypothetical protein
MKPLYIFDLDGTLALIEHRLHHIQKQPKDWRGFFGAVKGDVPNMPVIRTMRRLREGGADIWIWSGRSDECRDQTLHWLATFACHDWPLSCIRDVRMREAGDHRDDADLKRKWALGMDRDDKDRLQAVFDDRDRVVKMWRDIGVPCFQVAPGDF